MSENGDDKSQQSRRRVISSGGGGGGGGGSGYNRRRNPNSASNNNNRNNNNNNNRNNFKNNNNNNRNNRNNNNNNNNNNNANVINEKELASQLIQIQSKRFYIDVKENDRGRFIKLAEVGVGGRKSRILLTCGAALEFNDILGKFVDFNKDLPEEVTSETPKKAEETKKEEGDEKSSKDKFFYFDSN
jgi:hypothetical protein